MSTALAEVTDVRAIERPQVDVGQEFKVVPIEMTKPHTLKQAERKLMRAEQTLAVTNYMALERAIRVGALLHYAKSQHKPLLGR